MPRKQFAGWMSVALLCSAIPASAQFSQEGTKLVGPGSVGASLQGTSVAVSGDGSAVVVGGAGDNLAVGAAWAYTRANGLQSIKLVGGDVAKVRASQGSSTSVSADGNTLAVGGIDDNGGTGAMWIFEKVNGVWTYKAKLWGSVEIGLAHEGISVAVSADGNTAVIGGDLDNNQTGAAWVFTRTNGVWSNKPNNKLVGGGSVGFAHQGSGVALSADGNTLLIGGPGDNSGAGAAWVFTRAGTGDAWVQQGAKLVGFGAVGSANLGTSVTLSADGNTALIGGPGDSNSTGAIWIFTRANGQWTQQGGKLVGSGGSPARYLGQAVALSGDGNTAVAGGPGGLTGGFSGILGRQPALGGAWVFTRSNGAWSQLGGPLIGSGTSTNDSLQGTSVAISSDGRTVVVGGPEDNNAIGAAWIFTRPLISSPPVITTQPAGLTIASGQTATLSVIVSGAAPFTYQWYQGASGNTSTPVGSNASTYTTPALSATTSYWVRVSNSFGSVDSGAAVVAVPVSAPVITQVINAASNATTIAPNTWVSIMGTGLAPPGDTRTWQLSDFVNSQMPTQLDVVSAMVNGRPAYVSYISPTQVNILTPPDAMQGPVQVQVIRAGAPSAAFTAQAQVASPSFFTIGGGPYVAAEHADYSYLGPPVLLPGLTPAHPGETVLLFGNGFGPTSPLVTAGSAAQFAPLPTLPVIVIGGTPAIVQFAGLVAPGEFQFNVVVPSTAQNGDNTVTAVYNGLSTQTNVLLNVAR